MLMQTPNYITGYVGDDAALVVSVHEGLHTATEHGTLSAFQRGFARLAQQQQLHEAEPLPTGEKGNAAAQLTSADTLAAWWLVSRVDQDGLVATLLLEAIRAVFDTTTTSVTQEESCRLAEALLSDAILGHGHDNDAFDMEFDDRARMSRQQQQLESWLQQCGMNAAVNGTDVVKGVERSAFIRWLERSNATVALLRQQAEHVLLGHSRAAFVHDDISSAEVPSLLPKLEGHSRLLSTTDCWLLARDMPPDRRIQWQRLFSTRQQGDNWQQLETSVLTSGATLIVLRERDSDRVFGSFTYTPWQLSPDFFGDTRCYLFSTRPLRIYTPSGYNDHYQYLNVGTKTLPNGLGMGGQLNHFALWIAAENFGRGHSRAEPLSTTFRSPQLSGATEFQIDEVEVWCTRERERDPHESSNAAGGRSAMDKNPEAVTLLEMAGRTMYSKQVRDPDLDLSSDEDGGH
ncbi:TLD-domain-containing protein [Thamnocephalis sphaerospora]|uniref:MTOR-associated protein MEAK7 n=1 Tax=Thamnocephalis sphaerospora TaxID=78915 RepID=A0A4V1IWK5_9FUNG|nr:TLD-domain-containing protein [Thamnocephalis sphaerospora]|eukprot:RKP07879.1 TLD-domain-containing protein [Thamnocephalis sphaerospora]